MVDEKKYPYIGATLTSEERLSLCAVVDKYLDVILDELSPGGAKVEPMRINMKPEWNRDKLQPIRRYAPTVEAALQYELDAQLKAGIVEPSLAL